MLVDIMKLSPSDLERYIHLQAIVAGQEDATARVRAARDYYRGEHPVFLTARQKEYLGTQLTDGEFSFNHNLIKLAVDAVRERLVLEGFTVNGQDAGELDDEDPDARLAGAMWRWWNANRLDSQQVRLYRRTLRDGRSYVMVDYDRDMRRPRFTLHKVYDGTTGIVLHRDPSDANKVLFATNYFYSFDPLNAGATGVERKTVYLPGEIRKYRRVSALTASGLGSTQVWEATQDDGDASWPLPWVDRRGRPLGVTVIEFQDPDMGLVGGIAGLQNALNKMWLDLLAAADTAGFPITTFQYDSDDAPPDGAADNDANIQGEDELRIAPGRALAIYGGRIDRLSGANLQNLIDTVWAVASALAAVARLPEHQVRPQRGTDFPSGEALKQSESGLVKKVEERQLMFGQSWADVMALAHRVDQTFGVGTIVGGGSDQVVELNINLIWADPNTRMDKVEAEVAGLHKALGVPDKAVWRRAGYSPEEIAVFEEEAALQRALEVAQVVEAIQATTPLPTIPPEPFQQVTAMVNGNGTP